MAMMIQAPFLSATFSSTPWDMLPPSLFNLIEADAMHDANACFPEHVKQNNYACPVFFSFLSRALMINTSHILSHIIILVVLSFEDTASVVGEDVTAIFDFAVF